jgi:tRNA (guanine37-N1)-methyltransferase
MNKKKIHFHIITLFPTAFDSYLNESIIKRAQADKYITVSFYNPRDFTNDSHKRVDQKPYGGGPGMVLEAESVLRAVQKALGRKQRTNVKIIFFEPNGNPLNTPYAEKLLNQYEHIIMICGRYEGIDARVKKILRAEGVSIGDYTLTGGELPAMVVLDVVTRRIPGVLGCYDSLEERRVTSSEVYTRPNVLTWKGKHYRVPKVLLTGNHKEIEIWKQKKKK